MTQGDADALLAMPKRYEGPATLAIAAGFDEHFDLTAIPHPEELFLLDLWRGRRNAAKIRFQTRARKVVILARVEINGAPHTNPDGEVIGGTHLHLYREGYGDRWATPLDPAQFRDSSDLVTVFEDFCDLCRIVNCPGLQVGLL